MNPYRRKIKTVQFIYIFKKVGLINQAPTRKQIPTEDKPLQEIKPLHKTSPYKKLNPSVKKSAGLIYQIPYEKSNSCI